MAADLENNAADSPEPMPLPGRDIPFPYVIVADEAFPLKPYLIRPFPRKANKMTDEERVFNLPVKSSTIVYRKHFRCFCLSLEDTT